MAARGRRVALATSADAGELAALRSAPDADDVIVDATSADDVPASKPSPGLVEQALGRAGVPVGRAVFVGDTVRDVSAAAKAGVPCVALRGGMRAPTWKRPEPSRSTRTRGRCCARSTAARSGPDPGGAPDQTCRFPTPVGEAPMPPSGCC